METAPTPASRTARLWRPSPSQIRSRRSIAPLWPEMTTCDGSLSLATVQQLRPVPPRPANLLRQREKNRRPSSAAISPNPPPATAGLHRLAAQLQQLRRRRQNRNDPAAHKAEYSPKACGPRRSLPPWPTRPPAVPRSARGTRASECAMIAGLRILGQLEFVLGPLAASAGTDFCPNAWSTSFETRP